MAKGEELSPSMPRTYAGPPNRKAAQVVTKYLITDMYAKAIQGMSAEAAVEWAHDEIAKVYV
jgi:multiple sugar transport system substrate-binding protein